MHEIFRACAGESHRKGEYRVVRDFLELAVENDAAEHVRSVLSVVEKWVLEKTMCVHPELRQTESLFTGLCSCGVLWYANVWMETEEQEKTLIVVELDVHDHLWCTRGRERERYLGLCWRFKGWGVVLLWNSVGHAEDLN